MPRQSRPVSTCRTIRTGRSRWNKGSVLFRAAVPNQRIRGMSKGMSGTERDWTEDFSHENGKYICHCVECKQKFMGHKRRAVCKQCAVSTPPASLEGPKTAEVRGDGTPLVDMFSTFD